MKKIGFCLIFAIALALNIFGSLSAKIYAEGEQNTIDITNTLVFEDSAEIGDESIVYNDTTFYIDSVASTYAFHVKSGVTLTLNNCIISGPTLVSGNVFYIEDGGKLILDTVSFSGITQATGIINNYGNIEIRNTDFIENYFSIVNNSEKTDSIIYESGDLYIVNLKKGYISVTENTIIEKPIEICISDKQNSGVDNNLLVVRGVGNNVFASKYINKFTHNSDYVLDYIGDIGSTEIKDFNNISLGAGDIIITERTFKVDYPKDSKNYYYIAPNCTFNYPLTSTDNNIPYLCWSYTYNIALNNYTAHFTKPVYSVLFDYLTDIYTTLTINTKISGETENYASSDAVRYLTGSNWAVFVNKPSGLEIEEIKYTVDGVENNNIVKLSEDKYENNVYMRPIVEFILPEGVTSPTEDMLDKSYNIEIDIIYAAAEKPASVNITKPDGVEIEASEEYIVGNNCTFTLTHEDDLRITRVLFNGEDVSDQLVGSNGVFTFTADNLLENNTIVVETINVLYVTPNPTKISFTYGEDIVLEENYIISESETIKITYTPNSTNVVGTYPITEAESSDPNYEIVLSGNTKYYTITEKEVIISEEILTQNIELTYYEGLSSNLTAGDFITSIPSYLVAELQSLTDADLKAGENTLTIDITLNDEDNYKIVGDTFIDVKLIIIAKEVDLASVITTKSQTLEYSETIKNTITVNDFIVNKPSYLNLVLAEITDINLGNNELTLNASISDDKYVLKNNISTISVVLIVTQKEIILSDIITLNNDVKIEYSENLRLTISYANFIDVALPNYITAEILNINNLDINVGQKSLNIKFVLNDERYKLKDSIDTLSVDFEIIKKEVSLSDVLTTKNYAIDYSTDIKSKISVEDFIESKEDFIVVTFKDLDQVEINAGDNTIILNVKNANNNYNIKDNETSVEVVLVVNPVLIEGLEDIQFESENVTKEYNGKSITLEVIGSTSSDIQVTYKYYQIIGTNNEILLGAEEKPINCGRYKVEAVITSINPFYTTNNKVLTAYITITKVDISKSEYVEAVKEFKVAYTGVEEHIIDAKQSLLTALFPGVTATISPNKLQKNVSTYTYKIILDYDNENYICSEDIYSKLIITPILVEIELAEDEFVYTGEKPNLVGVVTNGLLEADEGKVNVNFDSNSIKVNADTHYINIDSIDNSNYYFDSSILYKYVINKATITLTEDMFKDVDVIYDGKDHAPIFEGTLPVNVTSVVEVKNYKDAVNYKNVKCSFVCNNPNYLTPEPLYADVNISKRPLIVRFTGPDNVLANGVEKVVKVAFENVVEGENIDNYVRKEYTNKPINAGVYTCTVYVDNNNYYIENNNEYTFSILRNATTYHDSEISLIIEGKFAGDGDISVKHTEGDIKIINSLRDLEIKKYKSINLMYSSYSTDPVKVSISTEDLVENIKYLRVFKFVNGELIELEYSEDDGLISFILNSGGDLIFVEEHSILYRNRYLIIALSVITMLSIAGVVVFSIIHHKKKKINKEK